MNGFFKSFVLLHYPFRVFFWLTGIYGVVIVLAWMGYLFGGIPMAVSWSPLHWHSHEMLFGLVTPAIAGFMMTAMCNWTGAPPLRNGGLLALASLWVAGRIAMWLSGVLPILVIAIIDGLFLYVLAFYVLRVLLKYGNKRNLVLGAILLVLGLANTLMHTGFVTGAMNWLIKGQLLALNLIAFMMVVIGGRIIPLFTTNWFRREGLANGPSSFPLLEKITLLSTALLIPAEFSGVAWPIGGLALIAAVANGLRCFFWKGWHTGSEPLLWILHLGYFWIAIALLLKGLATFNLVASGAWLHAMGTGAMGTLILGFMTRVALGHTGRAMQLPDFAVVIYWCITLSASARVLAALQWVDYRWGLTIAAIAWTAAFALFAGLYWSIFTGPRVDGLPG
ncbi:NnrS family protein [Cellvibrio polysaccharolyticus]|uniref:NnrS family protein n=1 Tax=Cellvibrio polysaccharolyticus TaxID=2082724 RepID=A0A928V855_9GAMM|nr:NnrS family protein [Cellvibrio polysaccharolyticus]MBE8718254.1 NnrS family protein [Cellvibrio polysaccharolyticus]